MVEKSITICPFCEKEVIETLVCERRQWSPYQGEPDKMVKSKEVILSQNCSSCGKTREEIENRIRNGKQTHHNNVLNRLKKQGLPLEITERFSK